MKKIFSFFFVIMMILCFVACENKSDTSVCASCSKGISINAAFCEHCGAKVQNLDETVSPELNSTEPDDEDVPDHHVKEFDELIDAGRYEDAYKKLDDIKDKEYAEKLRERFTIINNVLISKEFAVPEDKLGNKIGPFSVTYIYDEKGKLVEINANDTPVMSIQDRFNPFMKHVYTMNCFPYREKLIYDSSENLLTVTGYNPDLSKILYIANFSYNENNQIDQVEYNVSGWSTITTFYNYDENGLLTTVGTPDPPFSCTKTIAYDENGNPVEDGTIYNEHGQIVESTFSYTGYSEFIKGKCTWNYGDFYIYSE